MGYRNRRPSVGAGKLTWLLGAGALLPPALGAGAAEDGAWAKATDAAVSVSKTVLDSIVGLEFSFQFS